MTISELFKPKNRIIGKITNIQKKDNALEGVKQNYYCFDIITDDNEHFKEQIPCRQEIINSFINEIKTLLPETRDLQDEEDIIRTLKGKRFEFVKRQFGSMMLDKLPPLYYFFPSQLTEQDEEHQEYLFHKYSQLLPDIIQQEKIKDKLFDERSFKKGYQLGIKKALNVTW